MANIASLFISLGLDAGKFETDMKRTDRVARREINKTADSIERGIGRAVTAVAGAATAIVGSFSLMARQQIQVADETGKVATRLGETTEALSQYRFVAEQTGVSQSVLETSFERMQRRVSQAAQGTGAAKRALDELGVSAESLNNLRPSQQFEELADALQGVEGAADKARLAYDIFGRSGVELLQTMEGGSAAIRELRDQADQLGLTISQQTALQAAVLNDRINELRNSVTGAVRSIVADMLPSLIAVVERFQAWIKETNAIERARSVARAMTEATGRAFTAMIQIGGALANNLRTVTAAAIALTSVALTKWALSATMGMGNLAIGLRAVGLVISRHPILIIGTVIAGVAVMINRLAQNNDALRVSFQMTAAAIDGTIRAFTDLITQTAALFGSTVQLMPSMETLTLVIMGTATALSVLAIWAETSARLISEVVVSAIDHGIKQIRLLGQAIRAFADGDGIALGATMKAFEQNTRDATDVAGRVGGILEEQSQKASGAITNMLNGFIRLKLGIKDANTEQQDFSGSVDDFVTGPGPDYETLLDDIDRATNDTAKSTRNLSDRIQSLRDRADSMRAPLRAFAADLAAVTAGMTIGAASAADLWTRMREMADEMRQTGDVTEQTGSLMTSVMEDAASRIDGAFANMFSSALDGLFDFGGEFGKVMSDIAGEAIQAALRSTDAFAGFFDEAGGLAMDGMGGYLGAIPGLANGMQRGGVDALGAVAGAIAGGMFGGPAGASLGSMLGSFFSETVVGRLFGGSSGTSQIRVGTQQADRARSDFRTGAARSAFGDFFLQTDNVSGDARDALPGFINAVEEFDRQIANFLSPEQVRRAADRLQATTQTLFDSLDPRDLLPERLQIIGDAVDPIVGGLIRGIENLEDKLQAFEGAIAVLDFLQFDFAGALDDIRAPAQNAVAALQSASEELTQLAIDNDGTAASVMRLAQGTQAFQQQVMQFVAALEQVRANVQQITQSTIDSIRLEAAGGATTAEGFRLQAERLAELQGQLGGATDPGQIQALTQQINQIAQQLFSIVQGADDSRGFAEILRETLGIGGGESLMARAFGVGGDFSDSFIGFLEGIEDTAADRINELQEQAIELAEATQEATRDAIVAGLEPAAERINEAGGRIERGGGFIEQGGNAINNAARLFAEGVTISVDVSGFGDFNPGRR